MEEGTDGHVYHGWKEMDRKTFIQMELKSHDPLSKGVGMRRHAVPGVLTNSEMHLDWYGTSQVISPLLLTYTDRDGTT